MITQDEILNRMNSHSVDADQCEQISDLRQLITGMTLTVVEKTPAGREQSLAITHLEEALMWAVKAIAKPGSGS